MADTLGELMAEQAELFRDNAWDLKPRLDYTVASAYIVDQFVDDLLRGNHHISDEGRDAMSSYVGEIIRRNVGGDWLQQPDGPHPDDPVLAVRGHAMYPFDKVRKRIALGNSNSLGFFVEALVQSSPRPVEPTEKKHSRFGRKK